jgi:hypothetical protein
MGSWINLLFEKENIIQIYIIFTNGLVIQMLTNLDDLLEIMGSNIYGHKMKFKSKLSLKKEIYVIFQFVFVFFNLFDKYMISRTHILQSPL